MLQISLSERRLTRILDWIAANASNTVTLRDACVELGMSPSTAQRALRAAGLDFRNAVSLSRLENAERLLRQEPTLKVEALSLSAGWRSRRSLYVNVQRTRGCSVAEWRQQILNQ